MSQESIEEIKAILEHQNERMEHLIWQVVGNERLGIEGLKPGVLRIEKDLQELKVWRDAMWKLDLKKIVTKETINTVAKIFIYAIGIGGGSFGFFELLNKIFNS